MLEVLLEDSIKIEISFLCEKTLASGGDSIASAQIYSNTALFTFETRGNLVYKYSDGEYIIDGEHTGGTIMFYAVRQRPFTANWQSYDQMPGSNENLHWKINDNGYIAFKKIVNQINIYGWMHIEISPYEIEVIEFGYQLHQPPRAGN